MHKISKQEGFTIIEVIVAVFVIAVGLLAVAGGFLGERSLVEDTKRTVAADEQIASEMENIKFTNYTELTEPETAVTVFLGSPVSDTTSVTVKIVTSSSNYTSTFFHGQQKTRAIKFYVYEKGINYRP